MATTHLMRPQRAPSASGCGSDAARDGYPAASELPTAGEMVDEIVPLVGVVAVVAPPVILLAGPWLLLGLMLSGPFALVVAMSLLAMALVAVIAAILAILASPFVLVRHLRARHARRAMAGLSEAVAPLVAVESRRVVA